MNRHLIRWGGCYTLDEKVGQTYVHFEQANTLAARDYKQPQLVCYEVNDEEEYVDGVSILSLEGRSQVRNDP